MEYAARLPHIRSRGTIVAPLVALVLGAGAATGAYALIDDNGAEPARASQVILVESPAPGTADIPGKNEASTATAITQSGGVDLRGSKASSTDTADPHGPAASLRNP
jgi:hypothetical protein